jgi:Holliday junction DNA helicase, RuvA subunit
MSFLRDLTAPEALSFLARLKTLFLSELRRAFLALRVIGIWRCYHTNMIGTISGSVRYKAPNLIYIDVSGVGYKVFVTTDTSLEVTVGAPIFLWTYLAVRETALDLYGFLDKETEDIFELLIGVSGIGPKTALSILNVASPSTLRKAVANADTGYLTKVSGIGKKVAEKIVRELEGKLTTSIEDKSESLKAEGDVVEALLSLGYNERDIREAVKKIPKDLTKPSDKVKIALKFLSNN